MVHLSSLSPRRTRPSPDIPNLTKKDESRFARWPTLATMKPSRRWGTQILDVGHPAQRELLPVLRPPDKRRHIRMELLQHILVHIHHVAALIVVVADIGLQLLRNRQMVH